MAYDRAVQILNGDILFGPMNVSGKFAVGYTNLQTTNYGNYNYVNFINYPMPTTPTNIAPSSGSTVAFSPNGRYIVYTSGSGFSNSVSGITIFDCDSNTFTYLASILGTGTTLMCFSTDSSTLLLASDIAPYVYAIDLVSKTNKGTITGLPTITSLRLRAAAYGDYIYFINSGSGTTSPYYVYKYDKSTNSCTSILTSAPSNPYQYGWIGIDSSGYLYLAHGSTGAGRGLYVYDLNSLGTSPAVITTTNFFGSSTYFVHGCITSNGTYCNTVGDALRAAKINYGANVTATTITDISPTVVVAVNTPSLQIQAVGNYIFFNNNNSVTYPRSQYNIYISDVSVLTSGKVTYGLIPGYTGGAMHFAVHPSFTKRKLAGTVVDASLAPVARNVMVFSRKTGRLIAQQTSSAVDGSFEIFVYTTSQVMVIAQGTGVEVTKLIDNVVPVSP